jgi:peptidoglycan/LPS O-acetylase OafA/YrhL
MLTNTRTRLIPALDGLRGLAVLMVMCFHYFPSVKIFSSGWMGVDLFFVLSGYLITGRLLATRQDPDYFRKFYRNRILRIFPLYYGVLIIFYASVLFLAKKDHIDQLSFFTTHWISFFLFAENWTLVFHGLPGDAYITHFWSLAIEEQFYLAWPFVIYLISARRRLRIWAFAVIGVIIYRSIIYTYFSGINIWLNYYNTFCRIDSLIIGAMLCQLHISGVKTSRVWVNRMAILISLLVTAGIMMQKVVWVSNPFLGSFGYTCVAISFAALIHIAVQEKSWIAGVFNWRFLRFCGKISYGLYVFHWPLLIIVGRKMAIWSSSHFPGHLFATKFLFLSVSVIFSFVLSILSYRYFESYFLRLKK